MDRTAPPVDVSGPIRALDPLWRRFTGESLVEQLLDPLARVPAAQLPPEVVDLLRRLVSQILEPLDALLAGGPAAWLGRDHEIYFLVREGRWLVDHAARKIAALPGADAGDVGWPAPADGALRAIGRLAADGLTWDQAGGRVRALLERAARAGPG